MELKQITEAGDLAGKTVLVRSSCNVPLSGGEVRNSFRLRRAVPTLKYLVKEGARVIVISHLGREATDTLRPVFDELGSELPLLWGGTIATSQFEAVLSQATMGEIIFCENLRQDAREEANDEAWAQKIASYADVYVNDAFAEAHREHTSTYGVAKLLPAYAGITLAEEVSKLQIGMNPQSPSVFLIGGAKFETKMPLVSKYLDLYDLVFVGGALANDIFKARGLEVGLSMVSNVSLKGAEFLNSPKLLVPIDVVVEGPSGVKTKSVTDVLPEEKIFDMGPLTVALLDGYLRAAKTVLWNGPFGNYEVGFKESTEAVAKIIADTDAYSVLGGGDTVAAVEELGLNDAFGFISIGGGSMLTFLEHGSTPVLDLLKK
jgi:phosphoglycerate kinase